MTDLHIIPNEKITTAEIEYYRKRFNVENNPFIIFGGKFRNDISKYENVKIIEENIKGAKTLKRLMKSADRVHIHGFFSFWLLGILATNKKIGDKTLWYIWGDDLYCLMRPKGTLHNKVHILLRKKACKNIAYIATNIIGDYENAKKIIKKDYGFFELRFSRNYIAGILPFADQDNKHEGISILVGNSATPTNYHFDAFKQLCKYCNENITIYVPLSYGSKEYGDMVIQKGKELFGDRFIPLTEFMPKEEYFKFLMTIDVAVFANDRQQALGNIVALLYAGKKVYIKQNISSWQSLHDEYGIEMYDYSSIGKEDYNTFSYNQIDKNKQKKIILDMTDEQKAERALAQTLISNIS